jgi:hypothetical protein
MTLTTLRFIDEDAVRAAYPAVKGQSPNGDYVDDNGNKVTINDSTVAAKKTELTNEYNAAQYQRNRAAAYPDIADQLDMQYWDKKNGTTTWVDAVAKVKSDNPKP